MSFAVLAVINESAARSDREMIAYDYSLQLSDHLDDVVDGLRLRPDAVMGWNGWRYFEDVIVAQAPEELPDGTFDVAGVYLNPLGRAQRPADFQENEALRMMALAVERRELVSNSFGAAAPVLTTSGAAWGAAWFRIAPIEFAASRTRTILPGFLLVLAGVTLSTLVLLRRTVLDPVAGLARAAGRLEAGDLSARAKARDRQEDELGGLVRTFNAMAARLERYNRDLEVA
ncbi:MAG: HAMP domain-containing protein, partial [Planctomycetota bacterium]|nr:HAMP domain-containing protein [Planctomycetota bacterium]